MTSSLRNTGAASASSGCPIQLPADSRADSDRLLHFWIDRAEAGTGFRWAVILRRTGEFIGAVGYNTVTECAEYAYHIIPRWWGGGLASEASRGALDWRFGCEPASIEIFVSPSNRKSIRLAERLGFEPTSELVDDSRRFVLARNERHRPDSPQRR